MRRLGGVTAGRRGGGTPRVMSPEMQGRFDRMQSFKPQPYRQKPGGPGGRPMGPPQTQPPVSTVPGISVEMPKPGRGGPMPPQQGGGRTNMIGGRDQGEGPRQGGRPGIEPQPLERPGGFGSPADFQGFDPAVAFNRPLGMGMGGFGGMPPWMQFAGGGAPGMQGGPAQWAGRPGFGGGQGFQRMPWQQGGFEPQPMPWQGGMGFGGGGRAFEPQPFQV